VFAVLAVLTVTRPFRSAAPAGAAAVALALLTGCAGTGQPSPAPLPSAASTPSAAAPSATPGPTSSVPAPATTTGTTRSPVRWVDGSATGPAGEVQRAVRAYWSMVVRLAERPDPADPQLAALTIDPQQATLVRLFTSAKESGLSQRGPIFAVSGSPAVRGTSAQTTTCLDQTFVKVYESSGRPRPGSSGGPTAFDVRLRRDGGSWKVSSASTRSAPCTVPR
jgi:hypothetical protein